MSKIAFIRLGDIGGPMAINLRERREVAAFASSPAIAGDR